ncbi:helix-turn-helix domain-containing protein [Streptomyces sp. FXJ1.172]|uniref:helix-turn-helix domain-containing protein n=1 Tax=Streptomyces sp. FXJ1.172 TaxID=710705 RepID=UPI00099F50B3|nr:helix-turn-helix domain-containing protein [Streptomyces sp. FXJ1.172]WEO93293.1 helix-turn-helix domain-containing protein [Streptomyces sp. FXJ1.172]
MHGDLRAGTAAAGRIQRADDVLDMQRAARKGGTRPVLRWLADRIGATVFLMDSAGTPAHLPYPPHAPLGDAERDLALRGARELAERRLGSVAIDQDGLTCIVLPLDGSRGAAAPLLAAVVPRPAPHELPLLLADATSVLSLSWLAEHTRRKQHRLRIAEAGTREAVLQLLLNGHTSTARQIARALRPALPAMVRVYVIEGSPRARGQLLRDLTDAAEDAWIVTCPVYVDHLFMLTPDDGAPARVWSSELAATCCIGESSAVPLRETATGYAQAFHALAAARGRPERKASFAANPELAPTIGPAAAAWAEAFLSPIRTHRARRAQDPDSAELLATAASWLSFSSRATAHLDIHRNTLSARLTCIQELLGLDLHRLADQAALALALRTVAADMPPPPEADSARAGNMLPTLDELLSLPRVAVWAQQQFRPVTSPDVPACIAETLTTWLRLDARIGPTATAMSISTSAVRKRLTRSEALLKRSLLRSPSAIHDQWLALRALDLAEPSEVPRHFAGLSRNT